MTRPPVLVLAAGLGTRLRPLTYVRAKAAVPVNGRPLAERAARWLASHGFTNQVFNLHHHPASVAACLGDGAGLGIRIRYSWEQPVLGSAGGPRHALALLTDGGYSRMLLVNGDTLTNVDLDGLLRRHEASGARVTMALIPNPAPARYGGVSVDANGAVTGFTPRGQVIDSYHFIGVQVAEADVFAGLDDGVPSESVGALYPAMMREAPGSVAAYVSDASFQDIGTPADLLATSVALTSAEGDHLVSPASRVPASAILERTAVWDDVVIGDGAHLVDCIVADGCRVPQGMTLTGCAVVPDRGHTPQGAERIEQGLLIHPFRLHA
jgi:mannose-1-phosphate guanylyltransferase